MDDDAFLAALADELAALPHVLAVTLGGSRSVGAHRAGSDWDLGIYYRGAFDPASLRALGYEGEVSELGAWGGGVFNGGAWLVVDGRRVDVHYRDLDVVDAELAAAERGEFRIEPLAFHLAGIPSYLLLAELARGRVLRGELPRPTFPPALRAAARDRWADAAAIHLAYARTGHAERGRAAQCVAMLTLAATQTAHAVLAARGEWVTNEKGILERAGLGDLDRLVVGIDGDPAGLERLCDAVTARCDAALAAAP